MAGSTVNRYLLLPSSGLKMEATNSSEMLVSAYQLHISQINVLLRNKHKALTGKSQGKRQQGKLTIFVYLHGKTILKWAFIDKHY
jgi:hypothetical protein